MCPPTLSQAHPVVKSWLRHCLTACALDGTVAITITVLFSQTNRDKFLIGKKWTFTNVGLHWRHGRRWPIFFISSWIIKLFLENDALCKLREKRKKRNTWRYSTTLHLLRLRGDRRATATLGSIFNDYIIIYVIIINWSIDQSSLRGERRAAALWGVDDDDHIKYKLLTNNIKNQWIVMMTYMNHILYIIYIDTL